MKPDTVFSKTDAIDVVNPENESLQAVDPSLTLAQQIGKTSEHAGQFARSGANDLLLSPLFDQVTQRANPVFDFMEHDRESHAGQPRPEHGVAQLVVVAFHLVH